MRARIADTPISQSGRRGLGWIVTLMTGTGHPNPAEHTPRISAPISRPMRSAGSVLTPSWLGPSSDHGDQMAGRGLGTELLDVRQRLTVARRTQGRPEIAADELVPHR